MVLYVIRGTFPVIDLASKGVIENFGSPGPPLSHPDLVEYLWDASQTVGMMIFAVNLGQKSHSVSNSKAVILRFTLMT